jgi:AAA15 family ATPase/GTPase
MIQSLSIQNYKSVQDLNIELGQFNVFIGENGCGKTNILEGIAIGSAAISNKLDDEFLAARGVRVTEKELMKSAFEVNENNIFINILNANKVGFELKINVFHSIWTYTNLLITENQNIEELPETYVEHMVAKGKDAEFQKILNDYVNRKDIFKQDFFKTTNLQNFLTYTPENYFLRRFEEEIQIKPLGIRGEGLFKHIKDLHKHKPETLAKIQEKLTLISWFEGFEIPTDLMFSERRINIKDRYLAPELQFFDQRSSNEGFLYLLFYFTLFISEFTPKFFAIDNIDNALNPKLCSKLIEVLSGIVKENQKQVILTTHNPAILDGLDLTDDTQRLFVIYRNADGHTKAKRVMPQKTVQGVEPVRLSEAFLRGYIGGLPKNF